MSEKTLTRDQAVARLQALGPAACSYWADIDHPREMLASHACLICGPPALYEGAEIVRAYVRHLDTVPSRTRYYLDTEFIERPGLLDLISIGIACEDGREFYAVSSEFDESQASDWVRVNVLAKLGDARRETRAQVRDGLLAFIGDTRPEFWGYFADYDWVLLCWLFGAMVDLPKRFPKFCLDLKQVMHERGITKDMLPPQPKDAHHALADARWMREAHAVICARSAAVAT